MPQAKHANIVIQFVKVLAQCFKCISVPGFILLCHWRFGIVINVRGRGCFGRDYDVYCFISIILT